MKSVFEKIRKRIEEITVDRNIHGSITGCNMGICEDDDCLKCLQKKVFSIVSEVEAEYGNGWIPVEKALPEEDGWYLVYTKPDKGYKSINKARFIKNYDYHWHGAGGIWRNVAYWMPLPSPYQPTTD